MGYDQIDISPNTLTTPTVFFKTFPGSVVTDPGSRIFASEFKADDNLDPEISLIEEKRRVFWEVYAIDKWYSLVTGLPCAFSVDSRSLICTKLPSPTTFLPLNGDMDPSSQMTSEDESSFYLHEAMQKLDKNQVLIDLNSSSSKILLLTISENIIKWCKMFLTIVELDTLRSDQSLQSIRLKIDELVRNFENLQSNLLFFDLTTEPLMNIVINNTTTLLYQSILLKLSSLFSLQLKEDPTGATISSTEKSIFTEILGEASDLSIKLVESFIKKQRMEHHLKKAPIFIIFSNSLKSLLQCAAYVERFQSILDLDKNKEKELWNLIETTKTTIYALNQKQSTVSKVRTILERGSDMVEHSASSFSFFDSFLDAW
ncbi:DEKNAAC100041 [Brettanomyces naardenensis]|uniref:DEKNAAC100041 n=1 Tax=Brettanomyces naardenensis TaxID=13370 RepID=A0A448YFU3_BRENA|nr:DEKNAAC100041 [Brettanomyces naardenensis]